MVSLSKAGAAGRQGPREPDAPPAASVQQFHTNADTDGDSAALHHTIGPNSNQATGGDHTHNGGDSSPLLQGVTVSGVRGSAAYNQSIEAALVRLGGTVTATG